MGRIALSFSILVNGCSFCRYFSLDDLLVRFYAAFLVHEIVPVIAFCVSLFICLLYLYQKKYHHHHQSLISQLSGIGYMNPFFLWWFKGILSYELHIFKLFIIISNQLCLCLPFFWELFGYRHFFHYRVFRSLIYVAKSSQVTFYHFFNWCYSLLFIISAYLILSFLVLQLIHLSILMSTIFLHQHVIFCPSLRPIKQSWSYSCFLKSTLLT